MAQCEGWRRTGGAFTFGPPVWKQCTSDATVTLTVTQNDKTETLPTCQVCWQEAIDKKITILEVTPLLDN